MKNIIFSVILIFVFCYTAFAQTTDNSCPKIVINSPDKVWLGESFTVTAKYEKLSSELNFDWTIIKGEKITKVRKTNSVVVNSDDLELSEPVTILIESTEAKCSDVAMARIPIIPRPFTPTVLTRYEKIDWNEERAHLDEVVSQTEQSKNTKLYAFFNFTGRTSSIEKRNHISKVLNYLTAVRKVKKDRIILLISESEMESIRFYLFPQDSSFTDFFDCLSIKGEDFAKLNKLFQSRTLVKNRKK